MTQQADPGGYPNLGSSTPTYSGNGNWYDPSAYDPNNPLSGINTLSGLKFNAATPETSRETESGTWVNPAEAAYVTSSNGTKLYLNGDDKSGYTFSDNYNDPLGQSTHDQTRVTYKYDPNTGTATPIGNQHYYQGSDWTNTYRDVLTYLAPVVTAGLGGAYFGGAGAAEGAGSAAGAAEGAGELSGMDLAADAALGSGNNIYTAGSALGAGDAAAGASGIDAANTGSDAHFYNNPTAAEGGLGNMGGAGTATIPTVDVSGSSFGDYLKDLYKGYKNYKNISGALGGGSGSSGSSSGLFGLGGGASLGDRYRQMLANQALASGAQQKQELPGWIPGG